MAEETSELDQLKKEIEALRTKNRELLDEKKSTKTGAERQLADAQDRIDELTVQLESTKRETEKTLKQLTRERDEAVTTADGERKAVTRLTVDNELTDALSKAGVKKELIPAARALLKEQGILEVEAEGDVRRAVAKMVAEGKEQRMPLGDYITKHFATSEIGKAFIPASGDSGGGAGGVSFKGTATRTASQAEISAMKPTDRAAFFAAGGAASD